MTEQIVHVIDDDEAMRQSLTFLLEASGYVALAHESAVQFLERAPSLSIGCIVTDVRMPEMSGLELVRRMRTQGLTHPVIVITGHGDVPLAVEAMKAGVVDFLEKPFDDEALVSAVRSALDATVRDDQRDGDKQKFEAMLQGLSPREQEVLHGVVAGKPNKVIAYDLGISPRTVEVYRAHVMSKTGASSLSELVRMALLAGF